MSERRARSLRVAKLFPQTAEYQIVRLGVVDLVPCPLGTRVDSQQRHSCTQLGKDVV